MHLLLQFPYSPGSLQTFLHVCWISLICEEKESGTGSDDDGDEMASDDDELANDFDYDAGDDVEKNYNRKRQFIVKDGLLIKNS